MKRKKVTKKPIEPRYQDGSYYFRSGGKWIKTTGEFPENYAPGVWLVGDGSKSWFMRLGDTPTVMVAAAFHRHRDLVARTVLGLPRHGYGSSASEWADVICRAVAEAEDAQMIGGKP